MHRAMRAFLAVVAFPGINKLRVINTLNSSTAASQQYLVYFQQLTSIFGRAPSLPLSTSLRSAVFAGVFCLVELSGPLS